jgi:hypothetical protein
MNTRIMRAWMTTVAATVAAAATTASAIDVTVALVMLDAQGRAQPIEEHQRLWKSPFGGWAITTWPFALRVDDTFIMEYRSAGQKLEAKTMGNGAVASSAEMDEMLEDVFGSENAVRPEDLTAFDFKRRASQSVYLSEGRHTIQPFGIEFTLTGDGTVTSSDTRLRVDEGTRRLNVVCSPITLKMLQEERSVAGPMRLSYGAKALLGGLGNMFGEYDRQNGQEAGTSMRLGFRRVTVYLPASAAGGVYAANGVKFEVDAGGRVKLAADAGASCADGHTVFLDVPGARPVATARSPIPCSALRARNQIVLLSNPWPLGRERI